MKKAEPTHERDNSWWTVAPKPPQSFMVDGTRPTQRFRIRSVWFFYTVIERLWEHRDGSAEWRRSWSPVEFDGRLP